MPVWRPLASSPFPHLFQSRVTSQLLWELDSRGLWCSFGCHLLLQSTRCVYYRARCPVTVTTLLNILWNFIFPMKSDDWCLSLRWNRSVDVKLCQHSAVAPFPQTVYSVRCVHRLSSRESGLYWLKVRRVCVAGGQMVQTSFLWSCQCEWSYHVPASLDRKENTQKVATTVNPQQVVQMAEYTV